MTKELEELLIEALASDNHVEVGIWSFVGWNMICSEGCCEETYSSYEEAACAILYFARHDPNKISIYEL